MSLIVFNVHEKIFLSFPRIERNPITKNAMTPSVAKTPYTKFISL